MSTLAHAFDTYRVGSHLLSVGDSVSALIGTLGEPLYKEPVQSRFGGYIADRWQYRLDGKAVSSRSAADASTGSRKSATSSELARDQYAMPSRRITLATSHAGPISR